MIKKKLIIHYVKRHQGELRYLCNHAVEPTSYKSTQFEGLVTCKNCLNEIKKLKEEQPHD